jgi:hypothetical protein
MGPLIGKQRLSHKTLAEWRFSEDSKGTETQPRSKEYHFRIEPNKHDGESPGACVFLLRHSPKQSLAINIGKLKNIREALPEQACHEVPNGPCESSK